MVRASAMLRSRYLLLLLSAACACCLLWFLARSPEEKRDFQGRAAIQRLSGKPKEGLPDLDDTAPSWRLSSPNSDSVDRSKPEIAGKSMRVVHLDLKGAPPKMSYLQSLLPLMAQAGANGLLLEYEDMFPYTGTLSNISALNAYSMEEVQDLLLLAKRHRMEVIPLVQTFGHLEFALKLPEFQHLRELHAFPQELCPSRPESFTLLVEEMLRQVMAAHLGVRFLHIGCDEVYHLGLCSLCTSSLKEPK